MRDGRFWLLGLCLCLLAVARGAVSPETEPSPLADAVALYKQKKYAEARALLEPIAAAHPSSAPAAYLLGMVVLRLGGPASLDAARLWLGRATKLDPQNGDYLAEYAGTCLLMADRDNSFSLALEGRDGMTTAIALSPDDLEAREGLMRFYAKAPWPLGDAGKALSQAAEIARRDRQKGAAAYLSIAALFQRNGHSAEADSARRSAQSLAPDARP